MTIQVNLGNRKRKELAEAVGGVFNATPTYKGPPSYAYEAGRAIIDREGNITFKGKSRFESSAVQRLMEGLRERGFEPRLADAADQAARDTAADETPPPQKAEPPAVETEVNTPETAAETDKSVIRVPLEGFDESSLENVRLLVDSKALILKKAMNVCDLTIRKSETTLDFPWFDRELPPHELAAYTNFITAMCEMAKRQKRVMATEKPTDNEKFVLRLFLVRLGLIGDEYADTRRIMLRDLKGNGSAKSIDGAKKPPSRSTEQSAGAETVNEEGRAEGPEVMADQKCVSLLKKFGYFLLHIDD